MSAGRDSRARTLAVAFAVSAVCSVAVSLTAVLLRDKQQANVEYAKQERILAAVGKLPSDGDLAAVFAQVQVQQVELATGQFVQQPVAGIRNLSPEEDLAQIRYRENGQQVYLFFADPARSRLEAVVLPVRGYGLWSTLHGYLALDGDLQTVLGLEFYEHKETAGLGGEVDNPSWKALWHGKKIYLPDGNIGIEVVKGKAATDGPREAFQVDGLAGATLTSRGVTQLLAFWLSELGYGPVLQNLRKIYNADNPTGSQRHDE